MRYTNFVLTSLLAASHLYVCHGKPLPTASPDDPTYTEGFPAAADADSDFSILTTTSETLTAAEETTTTLPGLYPTGTDDFSSTTATQAVESAPVTVSATTTATGEEHKPSETAATTTAEEHDGASDGAESSDDEDSSDDEASSDHGASSDHHDHACGRLDPWTINSLSRACDDTDTVCGWSFLIDTNCPSQAPTPCSFSIKSLGPGVPASRSPKHEKGEDELCGPYEVHSSWSGQFGPGQGFTTLSVIDNGSKLGAYPAYRDDLFGKGKETVPDVEVKVYALA